MRRVALIPARGGSKRLPRKNIIDFLGKPIIAWTIEAALETGLFEQVVVSTEDDEIAAIAARYGAGIDRRDAGLATDSATVRDVCVDFLKRQQQAGNDYDVLCVLYATAPLRRAEDIAATVSLLREGECSFALAATHYPYPPHQALRMGQGGAVTPFFPDLVNLRAADVGEMVVDNGSTYAVLAKAFLKAPGFYGEPLKVHLMPHERSQDIDTADDLELALYYGRKRRHAEVA